MITKQEQTAAIMATRQALSDIITHFVPAIFQGFAHNYLDSKPELAANVANACLLAVEDYRARNKPAVPPFDPPPPMWPSPPPPPPPPPPKT